MTATTATSITELSWPHDFPSGALVWCDVFARQAGEGNPTLVIRLSQWPSARELAELSTVLARCEVTFVLAGPDGIELRWFSGEREVPLCGHGALAASFLLAATLDEGFTEVVNLPGKLWLTRSAEGPGIALAPATIRPLDAAPRVEGIGDYRAFDAGRDYLLVLESEAALSAVQAETIAAANLDKIGLILTAPSATASAAFRFFAPAAGIPEDDASASVIPALVSYWGSAGEREFTFQQKSRKDVTLKAWLTESGRVCTTAPVVVNARGRLSTPLPEAEADRRGVTDVVLSLVKQRANSSEAIETIARRPLDELGIDSMGALSLLASLEKEIGLDFDKVTYMPLPKTVPELLQLVARGLEPGPATLEYRP